jgi:general L-amino acid transport system permease protein
LFAINNRGFYVVAYNSTDTTWILLLGIVLGLVAAFLLRRWRFRLQEQTGEPSKAWLYMLLAIGIGTGLGWLLAGTPFAADFPVLRGPNVREGTQLSLGFVSVFVSLTLYTSAFVADIVRAGIQAVSYGQIEAARSQGLTSGQVLNLVVLPQALRLIIPPLGNQYVNMGKNSSLALVVGYFDTYQVALLANNESGQAVPIFAGLMVIYLAQSVGLSVLTNMVNRTTQVRTR